MPWPGHTFTVELEGGTPGHTFTSELDGGTPGHTVTIDLGGGFPGHTYIAELKTGLSPAEQTDAAYPTSFIFDANTQSWVKDTGPVKVITLGQNNYRTPEDLISIDQLVGIIDDLVGSIDDLSSSFIRMPINLMGTEAGEVLEESYDYDDDWTGEAFSFILRSPELGDPMMNVTLQELALTVEVHRNGTAVLRVSYDNGKTWAMSSTHSLLANEEEQLLRQIRGVTGKQVIWQLECASGNPRVLGWWAHFIQRHKQSV